MIHRGASKLRRYRSIVFFTLFGVTSCTSREADVYVDPRSAILSAVASGATMDDLNTLRGNPVYCRRILQRDCLESQAILWILHHELRRNVDPDEALDVHQTLLCDLAFSLGPSVATFALKQIHPRGGRAHSEATQFLMSLAQTRRDSDLLVAVFADNELLLREDVLERCASILSRLAPGSNRLIVPLADGLETIVLREQAIYPLKPERSYQGHGEIPYFAVISLLEKETGPSISENYRDRIAAAEGIPAHLVELRSFATRWRQIRNEQPWATFRTEVEYSLQQHKQELNRLEKMLRTAVLDVSFLDRVDQELSCLFDAAFDD